MDDTAAGHADVRDRLAALATDESGETARAVLRLLAVAEGPLDVHDLEGILNVSMVRLSRAIDPLADLIRGGWELRIGDAALPAVLGYFGQQELDASRHALACWCAELVASGQYGGAFPDYVIRHGAVTLAVAGDIRALYRLIDREWMRWSAERTGSLSAFIRDMLLAAQAAAAQSPPDRVQELRASLVATTALAIAADIPPDAVGVLAMAGQHQRASDLAAMITPELRSAACCRIAVALKISGHVEAADAAATAAIIAAESRTRESGSRYPLEHLAYSFRKNGKPEWEQQALRALRALGIHASADDYGAIESFTSSGDIDGAWEAAQRITEPIRKNVAFGQIAVALARVGRFQDAILAASTTWGLVAEIAGISAEDGDMARTTEIVTAVPAEHRRWAATKAGTALARAGRAEDAITLTDAIDDATDRECAIREVTSALAQAGHVDSAISIWTAAASGDDKDYYTTDMAKATAGTGDVDGALQIAAAIDSEHYRGKAIAHVASAAALGGDMRRATAIVRVIGRETGEDDAYAAVAKDLAAAGKFDDAEAAIKLIIRAHVRADTLVTLARALSAAGDYRRSAIVADEAVQADGSQPSGLTIWARSLTLAGEPGRAVIAAERAATVAEGTQDPDQVAEALAAWSAALAASGREDEALATAQRAIAAVDSRDESWHSEPQYWRERRAEKVAAILAEAGLPEQAVALAGSIAGDYDRDRALTAVAETLARRGLADEAINALPAGHHFSPLHASDSLGEMARIMARHGHGDAALRAAYALAEVEEPHAFIEYDIASLICEVVRILAENHHVEAALLTARKSRPPWNRAGAHTEIACTVALAGDIDRAVEIAQAHAGHAALAKIASALADAGRTDEALPIAEHAIRMVLTGPPRDPTPAEAFALLEGLARFSAEESRATTQLHGMASGPVTEAAAAIAVQAASEAEAITDPAEKIAAQAAAAADLARTADPALAAQAVALARTVTEHVRESDDAAELAEALGNAATALSLAGEPGMAVQAATECMAAAAASPFQHESDTATSLAIYVLADTGHMADALAGLDSLKRETTKVNVLCGIAKRLALSGRARELRRLVSDQHGLPSITEAYERILALTDLGRVLADTGEASMAKAASDMAADASALTSELTQAYQRAVASAGQAKVLAALNRCQEAIELARRAVEEAKNPIGAWRGRAITEAVETLVRCGRVADAAEAVKHAPIDQRAECVITVASALLHIGQEDQATELVSEELSAIREGGLRQAFYHLVCTQLPEHPDLFRSWISDSADVIQVSQELAATERWWNGLAQANAPNDQL